MAVLRDITPRRKMERPRWTSTHELNERLKELNWFVRGYRDREDTGDFTG